MNRIGGIFNEDRKNLTGFFLPLSFDGLISLCNDVNSEIGYCWPSYMNQYGDHIDRNGVDMPEFEQFQYPYDFFNGSSIDIKDYSISNDDLGFVLIDGICLGDFTALKLYSTVSKYLNQLNFNMVLLICEVHPPRGCNKCVSNSCPGHINYFTKHKSYYPPEIHNINIFGTLNMFYSNKIVNSIIQRSLVHALIVKS